jgi:hypothetical protein
MKKNAFFGCLVAAALSVFGSVPAWSQSAIFDRPIKEESGKGWWETDPEQYRAMIQLESAKADLVIDASAAGQQAITVKNGSVIEIRFAEMYRGDPWRLTTKLGAGVHVMLTDFQTSFENGIAQIHKPGTRIYKFRVTEPGDVKTEFRQDSPTGIHGVSITFNVLPN